MTDQRADRGSGGSTQAGSRSRWIENLLRPTLIAGMMTCLATPFVVLLQELTRAPDGTYPFRGTYFLVFAFLASLEGILSERLLQARRIGGWAYLASRGAEALILLLLLKMANYIPQGLDQLWTDASLWIARPGTFISGLDLLTGGLFLILWVGSLYVARMAMELDATDGRAAPPPDKTSTAYYLWLTQPPVVRERQETLDWLGETILYGGVVMLVASTAIHFLLPAARVPAAPTLVYFALGVALLSQARFSVNYAGWAVQGIPVQPGIARRWLLWAAIFLVAVALIALLLPTSYTMGPVRALWALISFVFRLASLIFALIIFVFSLLLSTLIPSMEAPQRPPLTLEPAIPAAEQTAVAASTPWLEVLLSGLFWAIVLFIVAYALYRFARDRFGLLSTGEAAGGTWWERFLLWLRDLWRRWRTWQHGIQERLSHRRAERTAERTMASRALRFLSLRRLPPRELVRYFYLSAERRAAEAGQPRQRHQTPYEYEAELDERFPDLEEDLSGLTEAFVAARYDSRPVDREDAEAVKPLWQRIKSALRRRR